MSPCCLAKLFCISCAWLSLIQTGATDELPIAATPESCGLRSTDLTKMSQWVREQQYDVRSMILLRQGQVAFQWYAGGVTPDHNHNVYSVTKSVVATLAGIAVEDGKIEDVQVTLAKLYPQESAVQDDVRKGRVSLEDLLTMRSGFQCSRGNTPGPQRVLFNQIHAARDRESFILDLDMLRGPGETFAYGNAEPQIVAAILEHTYRERLPEMAQRTLFATLNFANVRWNYADAQGAVPGGYGLRLRAIDMAKLGQLYLQQGKWQQQQLFSPDWVAEATTDQTGTGYGYYWWTSREGKPPFFAARGVRGQQIYVDPDRQLVFVMVADLPPEQVRRVREKLNQFVIASAAEKSPLPVRERDTDALNRELSIAKDYVPWHREGLPQARLPQLPQ